MAITGDPTTPTDMPTITFVAQQTASDLVWHSAELVRRSPFVIAIGTFVIAISAITVITGDLSGIVGVLLGLSFLTGLFAVPFVLWGVRQRRDLLLAPVTVEIDGAGRDDDPEHGHDARCVVGLPTSTRNEARVRPRHGRRHLGHPPEAGDGT